MTESGSGERRGSDRIDRHAPSFSLSNKLFRVWWHLCWLMLIRWTPPQLHGWRRFVLRQFGAKIGTGVRIYASCRIWHPANLSVGDRSVIGPRVRCYNQGRIVILEDVVVSQDVTLCASTHDITDPAFPLLLRPIRIERDAWIAAEAFVGPGVTIETGAVLGARGVAMRTLGAWQFHSGNPAQAFKSRPQR